MSEVQLTLNLFESTIWNWLKFYPLILTVNEGYVTCRFHSGTATCGAFYHLLTTEEEEPKITQT
jgi:hypothetical protein